MPETKAEYTATVDPPSEVEPEPAPWSLAFEAEPVRLVGARLSSVTLTLRLERAQLRLPALYEAYGRACYVVQSMGGPEEIKAPHRHLVVNEHIALTRLRMALAEITALQTEAHEEEAGA